jgi:hypothetical protein
LNPSQATDIVLKQEKHMNEKEAFWYALSREVVLEAVKDMIALVRDGNENFKKEEMLEWVNTLTKEQLGYCVLFGYCGHMLIEFTKSKNKMMNLTMEYLKNMPDSGIPGMIGHGQPNKNTEGGFTCCPYLTQLQEPWTPETQLDQRKRFLQRSTITAKKRIAGYTNDALQFNPLN